MTLLLFEDQQRLAPIYHEVLPRSQWIALFHRAGSSHERNLIGTRVSFTKRVTTGCTVRSHIEVSAFHSWEDPSLVIIPLWVACWERAFSRLFMIIVRCGFWVAAHNGLPPFDPLSLSFRTPGILMSIASLLGGFLTSRMICLRAPLQQGSSLVTISLWLVLHLNLFALFFVSTSEQTVELKWLLLKQTQSMIPFVTCEISFGQYVGKLVFSVDVFDLDFGVQIDSIKQPIKRNSVSPGNMSRCGTPSLW